MFKKIGTPAKIITSDLAVIKQMMCSVCKLDKINCKDCGVSLLKQITVTDNNDLVDEYPDLDAVYQQH